MTSTSGRLVLPTAGSPGRTATARAHAKAILSGEHAVVHGGPAISLPVHGLSLTATVTPVDGPLRIDSVLYCGPVATAPAALGAPATALTEALAAFGLARRGLSVRIDGEIPAERGLGSSAAVAAAIAAAVARFAGATLDADTHFALVQAAERVAHGTPSGLDARSVTSPVPIWFRQGTVRGLPVSLDAVFVIADTGITGGTRAAVADVRALKEAYPTHVAAVLARIDAHTTAIAAALATGDATGLGERMSAVHELLRELTVSNAELDALVGAARDAGALGAKLTGGGRGGCMLALAADDRAALRVAHALRKAGAVRSWVLHPRELAA